MSRFLPLCLFALIPLMVTFGASSARAETIDAPPLPIERLVYAIKWGPFDAGRAVLEVRPDPRAGEAGGYRIELSANTTGLFKRVYPLELWIRSTLSGNLRRSLAFHKIQNDRVMRIRFDWSAGTAQYVREGREAEPIALPPNSLDPLALVMALRHQPIAPGSRMSTNFTDGRRSVAGVASVLREERIETDAGSFSTVVVEPLLQGVGGVFARSRNPSMRVWISSDARRLPVRISSRIMVGKVVGELVEIQTGPVALGSVN